MLFILSSLVFFSGILIVIHESGKRSSKNEFSRINDLSALFESSEVQSHKRFDFKSDLIRLITNMCYNHSKHQDLVFILSLNFHLLKFKV